MASVSQASGQGGTGTAHVRSRLVAQLVNLPQQSQSQTSKQSTSQYQESTERKLVPKL